ncbi:hypothetical protein ACIBO2_53480 [Nonomuraea sp. NPDC050022]|uniref:hypothetical protein n=1 Tax=Nonomuraea sp. NPDC050022 TaxID=3364358 RepID=UPI003793E59F
MDDVESRLGDVLGDPGRAVPPEGLADRVHRGVAVRRTRRRALMFAAAACAVVLAAGVPVAWRQIGGGEQTVANSIDGLEDLVDMPGSVALPKETKDAGDFFPEALGEDGSVLGRSDKAKKLWETGPEGGPLRPLNEDAGATPATGSGIRVWPGTNIVAPLYCQDQNGTTPVMPLNLVGSPFWVSGGTIVGSDPQMRPWTAKGCTQGAPVSGVSGEAVAFSYPDLFVADPFDPKGLREVNVESGEVAAQHPLPEGVNVRTAGEDRWQLWLAAANRDTFAWVSDGMLRTADRADWRVSEGPRVGRAVELNWGGTGIPADGRSQAAYAQLGAHLTAGNRLIVYTGHAEFDERPGWQSVVYDPRSGQSFEFQGVAYAAGDWLLWNDGTSYRLARVR